MFRISGICFLVSLSVATIAAQLHHNWQDSPRIVGGQTEARQPTAETQLLAESLRSQVEAQFGGQPLNPYQLVDFTTQVVAGTNWYFKILVGYNGKPFGLVLVSAFEPLGSGRQPLQLTGVQNMQSS
ncbi:hypothetical protein BV898_06349 [Hypsibius exemplaris]|uniref:Cystatin domain-containing protein n=1 Tax=Hypsibius exemplaris TaxID=2072580 RepID=A0A1W0WWL7_HYPEX|nr:hypothetical protein BV898_06349 [Hypsibius exemplaris]